jgi:hypothetical protein
LEILISRSLAFAQLAGDLTQLLAATAATAATAAASAASGDSGVPGRLGDPIGQQAPLPRLLRRRRCPLGRG